MQLGVMQTLMVVKSVAFGLYLADDEIAGEKERVLLPKKQVPEGVGKGDELEVFLYRDSDDRMIATTMQPPLTLGKTALLRVKEVGRIGAFLDWGLEKDLLLPFREQTYKVKEGDEVLVALYLDKSKRLCATMKIYHYLKKNSPYAPGDEVEGLVYELSDRFGVFVAVDNIFSGLIPKREAQGKYRVGEKLKLRITNVHEDGKLDLSARMKAHKQMNEDGEAILEVIREEYAGRLPFDDKADPEVIREEFGLSKAAFKRAVGHLMKEGRLEITPDHTIVIK